jgi:hypothetical protein
MKNTTPIEVSKPSKPLLKERRGSLKIVSQVIKNEKHYTHRGLKTLKTPP